MSEIETYEHILASLHEAALDDTRLATASALIDDALGVRGNNLITADLLSRKNVQVYFARFLYRGYRRLELEREYFENYLPLDERIPRAFQLPEGKLAHITDLFSEKELKTSVVYNEFSLRLFSRNSINLRLGGPPNCPNSFWGINDPVGGGDWSSAKLALIRRLLPHIRQYLSVRQVLAGAGALGASLMELLDTTGSGVIQLDLRGRILEVNDRARDLLRAGDGLFDERGFLFARRPEDNAKLQQMLARALPPFGAQGVSGSSMVRRKSTVLPLVLHINPVARQETEYLVRPVAALVLVVDLARRPHIEPVIAGQILGLTGMESRVAVLLAEGMSVREIARAMGRKESTVRLHVKHIFAKHGLSRQAELVRLVLSLAGAPESRD